MRLRVGALPQYPSNALNYNLTWSTDGVINEYCEPCEEIANGELVAAPALEEREEFSLDGVTYEAFNTSGGVGTLCETLRGRVRNLNYRTIRYPGHVAIMKALLQDLRLRDRRDVLKDILEHALPTTLQDVVIVFVTVTGKKKGQLVQETYANKIYGQPIHGVERSAIQVTTAAGICGGARPAGRAPSCRSRGSCARRTCRWRTSSPIASAGSTRRVSARTSRPMPHEFPRHLAGSRRGYQHRALGRGPRGAHARGRIAPDLGAD